MHLVILFKIFIGGLMRNFIPFFLIVIALFIFSCGKTEVKKISEESIIATEAFSTLERIKEAYTNRDIRSIEKFSTKDGFKKIVGSMKTFDSVELTLNPVLVEIENERVSVNVSWKGTWKKEGKTIEERGMAVFILKDRPLKVDDILRSNPFIYPN
jgi:hypothetical protein